MGPQQQQRFLQVFEQSLLQLLPSFEADFVHMRLNSHSDVSTPKGHPRQLALQKHSKCRRYT